MSLRIEKHDAGYLLSARTWLPRAIGEVFDFFCSAHNLELITPQFLRFEILTPEPIAMQAGTRLDYRLRLHGVPVRWQSEIKEWEPPYRFVDEQVRGPYRWWVHEHRFRELDGGTEMIDEVRYGVPGGALVHGLVVKRDLVRIFTYRAQQFEQIHASAAKG
jgi:ligand-binding SRPBCC domain-containing protein